MKPKEVVLFVYDEDDHFKKNLEFLGESTFKKIVRVDSLESLDNNLSLLKDDELVFLIVHVFFTEKIKGIRRYVVSGIMEKYSLLDAMYVSDGVENEILKEMIQEFEPKFIKEIKKYHQVRSSIENNLVNVFTKKQILENNSNPEFLVKNSQENLTVDYVVITALELDEMEKVLPMIQKTGRQDNDKHLIEYGFFKGKPEKKVAYASQVSTGMVDASILATEMLVRYNPKFLIMTGVLGGKPKDTKIGDVVVSTKVFTIDKGKISKDDNFKREIENSNTDNAYVKSFQRDKSKIIQFIKDKDGTRSQSINIHFEPVACVRQVIDKKGYFDDKITTIDRKTIALEMEGYGIARACELVNNGKTTPIIIKSVMDNTQSKTDGAKTYAAWTSAAFLEYIIMNDLI